VGGMPRLKSSGLDTSMSTFPASAASPAATSAAMAADPEVAFITRPAKAAASAKLISRTPACSACHCGNGGVPNPPGSVRALVTAGSLVPITTSWPSPSSLAARVRPTTPVPSTAILIPSPSHPAAAWHAAVPGERAGASVPRPYRSTTGGGPIPLGRCPMSGPPWPRRPGAAPQNQRVASPIPPRHAKDPGIP
jgi:hypothetical protein